MSPNYSASAFRKIQVQDFEAISECLELHRLANKHFLITGANGFLPAYLVDFLVYLNEVKKIDLKLTLLVRNLLKAENRFKEYLEYSYISFLEQDVSKPLDLTEKFDFIIHAASQASPVYYKTDPVGTLLANSQGTLNLLKYAALYQPESFLFFSSGEVYGVVPDNLMPISEKEYGYIDITNVRSCYSESKRLGEVACVSYFHQFGVKAKIVRPFHTYGPGMALDDGRVFSDFARNILKKENLKILGDGKTRRPYCYLSDALLAFILILLKGKDGEAYNVGNPFEEYSVKELADKLTRHTFAELNLEVEFASRNSNDLYMVSPILRNTPDIGKMRLLGWEPKINIDIGFRKTIESFYDNFKN